jgi:tRNA pseudouridine38-40 synthase
MSNYLLSIQYDGTNYCGWQSQSNCRTVQQEIEKAISIIVKEDIKIIGAGRTDAGVHAIDQKANFRTEKLIDIYKFKYSLNSLLPKDISILDVVEVPESFHARFDAKKRTYIYLITKIKSPFYFNYSYHYPFKLDTDYLNDISETLVGENDFSSFCKKSDDVENKICNVFKARWYRKDDLTFFKISANRFLRGMVRAIVGTLLMAEKNKYSKEQLNFILTNQNRELAGENVPAKGLFLYKVEY